ncbi:uncharacterized protein LOC101166556 isoform X7 [Oryzias latipes]|uniref:uncharacterized protein LOC101166556 isoform X7 n=1 Tax=Oryzias latipes TaxID=8090 RepID=UPI0005CC5EC6|nr:uncharacterized protein LOC101166556 isoform X7 [Oryzias latipes]
MKSVAHSLYLILMAFLSIIDPSTAGCYDELEKERWVMFKNESLSLVMAGDLMDSMNCTMKYYQNYTTWPEHLENNTNWKGLMNALKTCEINDTIKCQGRPKEEVPVFNFMCFLAKAVDLDLQGCGDYENLRSIYSRMPLQNSTGRNCQDDPFNQKRATDQNDKRVIVLKTLVVIFGISTIFGPVLVWLYMRQKVKMYTEQEVQDDNLL